jgi:predicted nucleotidyltransferase component of viral defense system
MKLSGVFLERCAAETGFQIGPLEKVVRLGEMAGNIARHPVLGPALALKGGTALNLCFGPPKRLSVDLDYNYVARSDREGMLEDRPRIEEILTELAARLDYRVQRSTDAFAGRKLFLAYRSISGLNERIEIDVNYLYRIPISGIENRFLWQPGELDKPRIRCIGRHELVIGKLLALLDRGAVRDAWDVANLDARMLRTMDSSLFRARFIAFAAVLEHPLWTYTGKRLKMLVNDRAVDELLIPLLVGNPTIECRKVASTAWSIVKPFLELKREERDYLKYIEKGEIRPECLSLRSRREADSIRRHPAILWKTANVREHLAKSGSIKAKRGR